MSKLTVIAIPIENDKTFPFLRTRLQQIENLHPKEKSTEKHVSIAWAVNLYLTVSENCRILSLEQTVNKWSNTFFKHVRCGRTSASVDMIKGKGMCANLYLHRSHNKHVIPLDNKFMTIS